MANLRANWRVKWTKAALALICSCSGDPVVGPNTGPEAVAAVDGDANTVATPDTAAAPDVAQETAAVDADGGVDDAPVVTVADAVADAIAAATDATATDAAQAATADTAQSDADAGSPAKPDLYDPEYLPKFELVVDAAALAVLMDPSEATKKQWVHAAFTCEGETLADVGLRRKGESTYRVIPQKAAFKVKFDKWEKGLKFRGLSELTLNNMVDDATALRERLAFAVYAALKLPAPKCNTALVTLNGEAYGPYANIETPNSQFLKAKFGANANTLYEADWGSAWLPGDQDGMQVDVGVAAKADLVKLFEAVAAASNAKLLADVQKYLDVKQWLAFCAAEAVLAEHDNYAYGVWGSHNYFMAGGADGKFRLVPWSVDLSLTDDDGGVDAAQPRPADPSDGGDTLLMRCHKTPQCWDTYKQAVAEVLTSYVAADLVKLATKWHAQIDAYQVADDKRECSLDYYQSSWLKLLAWMPARPGVVSKQLGLP